MLLKIWAWLKANPVLAFIGGLILSLFVATKRAAFWRRKVDNQVIKDATKQHDEATRKAKSVERQLAEADKAYQKIQQEQADALGKAQSEADKRHEIGKKWSKPS